MVLTYPYIIIVFTLGTLIGSFINVVGLRFNSGLSVTSGRSRCPSCNTPLRWYELVPVLSFIFLLGRCRTCNTKISFQYPLIELLSGLVFIGIVLRQITLWPIYSTLENGMVYSVALSVYYFVIFSILFVIMIYDFRHKIIPNFFVYTFIALSTFKLCLFMTLKYPNYLLEDYFDISAPFILFIFFYLLWKVSNGRWMGFGDVKLVFGIGAMLGFIFGISAMVLGFWIGAIWSIFMIVYSRLNKSQGNIGMQTELPFAPFLIAGIIIVFIFRIDVMNLSKFFIY